MTIDAAFIERKRDIIAQIERTVTSLPNPFLDLSKRKPAPFTVSAARKALAHTSIRTTAKRPTRKR